MLMFLHTINKILTPVLLRILITTIKSEREREKERVITLFSSFLNLEFQELSELLHIMFALIQRSSIESN